MITDPVGFHVDVPEYFAVSFRRLVALKNPCLQKMFARLGNINIFSNSKLNVP